MTKQSKIPTLNLYRYPKGKKLTQLATEKSGQALRNPLAYVSRVLGLNVSTKTFLPILQGKPHKLLFDTLKINL